MKTIQISEELHLELRVEAAKAGVPIGRLVEWAWGEALRAEKAVQAGKEADPAPAKPARKPWTGKKFIRSKKEAEEAVRLDGKVGEVRGGEVLGSSEVPEVPMGEAPERKVASWNEPVELNSFGHPKGCKCSVTGCQIAEGGVREAPEPEKKGFRYGKKGVSETKP